MKSLALNTLRWIGKRWPRGSGQRRILLDTRSTMAASYLEDLRDQFADDPRIRFFKTVRPNLPGEDQRKCLALVNCPALSYRVAKFYPWDLIVLADHPSDHLDDLSARFGFLRIPHGLGSKLVNGEDYFYGQGLYDREGRIRYSCIFEPSESRRAHYTAKIPALSPFVKLVGDLRIDKLRAHAERAQARPDQSGRPTVVFAGSWSTGNLFEKFGPALFNEAARLLPHYAFVIRPHPHVFNVGAVAHSDHSPKRWRELFEAQQSRGFVLSRSSEDPGWLLATASVIICDDLTSLALYAVALDKRIIMVPTGSLQVAPDAFTARLTRLVPNLHDVRDLESLLATVLRDPAPSSAVRALSNEINSRPGESTARVRTEVYQLLQLSPPN
jgi:hypothetical protein